MPCEKPWLFGTLDNHILTSHSRNSVFARRGFMGATEQFATDQLNQAVLHLVENIQATTSVLLSRDVVNIHVTVNNLLESWLVFTKQTLQDLDQIGDAQIGYWQDYLELCENLHQELAILKPDALADKENILISFIEKFCLMVSQHLRLLLANIFDTNNKEEWTALESYHRQFTVAIGEGNFKNDCKLSHRICHEFM